MTFEDDMKVKTIAVGDVDKYGQTFVHNVLLVDNLSYNMISVSQLCDRNLLVLFKMYKCLALDSKFNTIFKRKILIPWSLVTFF